MEVTDYRGDTPLQVAAMDGLTEKVRTLISEGADVNAKGKNGSTPLHETVGFSDTEITKLLIEAGADVNAKDRYGKTPLHLASKSAAKVLIENGAT